MISIDRVKENALEQKVEFLDELHRVIIHGVLHLIGYKDKQPKDEKLMRQKEDFYLMQRQ
jgi:rRNA maturation RNase YbeY